MTDVRDVLERELERLAPPRIAPERLTRRRNRKVRNQRIAAAIVAMTVSLLAAAGLMRAFNSKAPTGHRTTEPKPAEISLVDVRTGRAESVAASITAVPMIDHIGPSPDGLRLAFEGARSPGATRQIYIADVMSGRVRQATHQATIDATNPRWSPNGSTIVFEGNDGSSIDIFLLDVGSGEVTRVTRGLVPPTAPVDLRPVFTPGGRTITYTASSLAWTVELRTVGIHGRKGRLLFEDAAFGTYSPDGRSMVFRRTTPGYRFTIQFSGLEFARVGGSHRRRGGGDWSGTYRPLYTGSASAEWSPDGTRVAYVEGGYLEVLDLRSEKRTRLGRARWDVTWLDDETLIANRYVPRTTAREATALSAVTGFPSPIFKDAGTSWEDRWGDLSDPQMRYFVKHRSI